MPQGKIGLKGPQSYIIFAGGVSSDGKMVYYPANLACTVESQRSSLRDPPGAVVEGWTREHRLA